MINLLIFLSAIASAATYEVGPGKPFTSIGAVPWATLNAGDTVLIHWRSTPYNEKWVICRQGTAAAPIRIAGVLGTGGLRPVIDGANAVTAPGVNFWNENRGLIKLGGSNKPADTMPKHIIIENLDLRNAHASYTFRADDGSTQRYLTNAAAIYVEKGENITLRNNILRDSGNGLFVASSNVAVARNILVERNYLHNNGNVNSGYEHNSYTAAAGITFQYNRFGLLRSGAAGNNLKDRSAGLVVRYNWIEGGNRQLDLIDSDSLSIRTDPDYRETHVYGNTLIERTNEGNRQIVHYGGDSGNQANYRKGTLYFYSNTILSYRTDRNTLFRLATNDERCDARNNVIYTTLGGNAVSIFDAAGHFSLYNNWIKPGWVKSFSAITGSVNVFGAFVEGSSPGFINEAAGDYRPSATSPLLARGTVLHALVLPLHDVVRHYLKHQNSEARTKNSVFDIGAYERP